MNAAVTAEQAAEMQRAGKGEGSPSTWRIRIAPRTLIVDLATSLPPIEIPGTTVTKTEGPRQHLTFPPTTSAAPLVAQIAASYPLVDLSIADPTIESIIARLYASSAAAATD